MVETANECSTSVRALRLGVQQLFHLTGLNIFLPEHTLSCSRATCRRSGRTSQLCSLRLLERRTVQLRVSNEAQVGRFAADGQGAGCKIRQSRAKPDHGHASGVEACDCRIILSFAPKLARRSPAQQP